MAGSIKGNLFLLSACVLMVAVSCQQNTTESVKQTFVSQTNENEIPAQYIEISNKCRYTGEKITENIFTLDNLLPESTEYTLDKYDHGYFIIGYSTRHKQPGYSAWLLTRKMVQNRNIKRENSFREDSSLKCCMAYNYDYNRSGYDRGHMCPNGDMTWSKQASKETFLLSNICPQIKKLNQGRWNDLEVLTRAWATKNDSLLVIAGPVFDCNKGHIGRSKVTVPCAFYKIIIDISYPKCKAIAFIMDNAPVKQGLFSYATDINTVEKRTGLKFFPHHGNLPIVKQMKSSLDTLSWK